jgi:hypothetical protein
VLQGCFAAAQDNVLETSPWPFLPALEAAPVLQARGSEAGGSGSAGGIAYSPPPVLLWHGAENPAAKGFLEFLDTGGARSYIRASGYGTL